MKPKARERSSQRRKPNQEAIEKNPSTIGRPQWWDPQSQFTPNEGLVLSLKDLSFHGRLNLLDTWRFLIEAQVGKTT